MQEWIINIMNQFGYFGVAFLICIENVFPPIPSEVILTFGGFMTTYTDLNVWLVVLFATIGSVTGAIILYEIGHLLNPQRIEWLVNKWGRYLRIKMHDINKAEQWFNKRGTLTVFFCRFIPIVRSLISIPAGMANMGFGKFLFYTTLGTAIWNVVLVKLGEFAGANWEQIVKYFDTYSSIAYVLIALALVGFVVFFIIKKKKEKVEENK